MKIIKRISTGHLLMFLIIFFIPYTAFRVAGLKISELLTILLIGINIISKKRLFYRDGVYSFVVVFSVCIMISGLLSFIDPINELRFGYDDGVFYSFEFGWLLKIIRLFIVYGFYSIIKREIIKYNRLVEIGRIYVFSNLVVDLWVIILALSKGAYRFGINRTSAMAVESSEAGFINCFAIIIQFYFLFNEQKKERIKGIVSLCILVLGQLCIGSTSSLVCLAPALLISLYLYISKVQEFGLKKIVKHILLFIAMAAGVYFVYSKTSILHKITNYSYYLNIEGSSVAERVTAIETCWRMFLARPIFGVGYGNFGWYISSFITSSLYRYRPGGAFQPNILYAQLLAELGIVGLSVYLVFIASCFKKIASINKKGANELWMINMTLGLLVYLLVHNLTLTTLFSFQSWITFAFIESLYCGKVSIKE